MGLKEYKNKRNFGSTPEPKENNKSGKETENIFSIQFHQARRDHYDLRLAFSGVLLSWAIPKQPSFDPDVRRLAIKVEDHPLDYAFFEGEIPKGNYGAGTVELWDSGKYQRNNDFKSGLKEGSLKFTLFGNKMYGKWALIRTDNQNWLLIKEKDEFVKREYDFKFKQAKLADDLVYGENLIYELKYDGYRIAAVVNGDVKLITRNNIDVTDKYKGIATEIASRVKADSAVLDGELIAIKDGKPNFNALSSGSGELCYVPFDLLFLDGKDIRNEPLYKRKQKLEKIFVCSPQATISESFSDGDKLYEFVKQSGLEGVMIKDKTKSYFEDDWLKIKPRPRQEFVVCGYTSGAKEISSLILGANDGQLKYMGKVGSGIREKDEKQLKEALIPLITDKPTLSEKIKGAVWVKPKVIVEVEYAALTGSGKLRQASYKGIRSDKAASNVVIEKPTVHSNENFIRTAKSLTDEIMGIKITSRDKVIFTDPKVTKGDIIDYYMSVASLMLPYLKGAPVSILRCNDGIENCFFKKHPIGDKDGLIYIRDESDIIREVQLGAVEFHFSCAEKSLVVFDLDPDEDLPVACVVRGAKDVKKILNELGIKAFVKLSGGKGYHVVAFVECDTRELAHSTALLLQEKSELYTADIKKDKRKGKIFIDWQRNSRGATAVAPYSLRAKKGAKVSLPIPWSMIDDLSPGSANIFNYEEITTSDRWKQLSLLL